MNEAWARYEARIVRDYEAGLTLKQIAARVRSQPATVGNDLRRLGVTLRPRGRRPKEAT